MLSPNNINQDPICWEKLELLRLKLLFQVRLLPISTQLPHPPQNICIDESVSWDFRIGFGGEGFFFLFLHINIVLYVWELLSVQEVKKPPTNWEEKATVVQSWQWTDAMSIITHVHITVEVCCIRKIRLQLMIFHKKTQECILRDALELMKLIFSTFLTFFPKKSDFEVKVTGIRFVWGFLVNVPTVWIWSSTSLKLSCSRDFQKTWSLTLILRFRWLRFKFFQYF